MSTLANRCDVLVRFLKEVREGNQLALTDEKRATVILPRESKIADKKTIRHQLQRFRATIAAQYLEPARAGAANVLAQFPRGKTKSIDNYLDLGILDELKKSGFVADLQRKYGRR